MDKYIEHKEPEDKFLDYLDDFLVATGKLLRDTRVFPKSERWLGVYEVANIVNQIHTNAHLANNIRVTNVAERADRHAAQVLAIAYLKTLGEKFNFLAKLYDYNKNKLGSWLDQKAYVQMRLTAWMNSDEKRYKDIG